MAKDVSSKSLSNNNIDNSSSSISDQQKVPPLRIVLNTSGNQKSSSTTSIAVTPNQQTDLKRDKSQDGKAENTLKTGGRVRIKLGINKQPVSKVNSTSESSNKSSNEDNSKTKSTIAERQDSSNKEDNSTSNYSHLRRITRRSNRTVQTVSNEDEESISSMTSTDENQTAISNSNSDNSAQDTATSAANQQTTSTTSSSTTTTTTTTVTNSSLQETPRRYKRRKVETTECPLSEQDGLLSFQNYKLPTQNSFELYRNIRKQVDKKLKSLNSIHPRTPFGFRDYMLTRGSYLLDGNKLGNGTNLFVGEDGGLHPAPMGKYHALRFNRVNYSVPNRAKVPLGLPVNSALYNLFIDQEKERFRMRMQHIKEREKLTLSAEQEIMRVYNQAAMAAANQLEPFSACTMLKHQEIYNYIDSDGLNVSSSEDALQDESNQTNRQPQDQISSPTRKQQSSGEKDDSNAETSAQKETVISTEQTTSTKDAQKGEQGAHDETKVKRVESVTPEDGKKDTKDANKDEAANKTTPTDVDRDKPEVKSEVDKKDSDKKDETSDNIDFDNEESDTKEGEPKELVIDEKSANELDEMPEIKKEQDADENPEKEGKGVKRSDTDDSKASSNAPDSSEVSAIKKTQKDEEAPTETSAKEVAVSEETKNNQPIPMDQDKNETANNLPIESEHVLSDDDRRAHNKEIFLSQLQDVDDKWEKIRQETLVRHRNEAESLHAVQRLEWEWKTKEIGACDVRMTPIIDNTLVPKLYIYSHDY